jgi:hypothetical protein
MSSCPQNIEECSIAIREKTSAKEEDRLAAVSPRKLGGMFALGQKQTFRSVITMSALPPKATVHAICYFNFVEGLH